MCSRLERKPKNDTSPNKAASKNLDFRHVTIMKVARVVTCQHSIISGQIIIFHLPPFSSNRPAASPNLMLFVSNSWVKPKSGSFRWKTASSANCNGSGRHTTSSTFLAGFEEPRWRDRSWFTLVSWKLSNSSQISTSHPRRSLWCNCTGSRQFPGVHSSGKGIPPAENAKLLLSNSKNLFESSHQKIGSSPFKITNKIAGPKKKSTQIKQRSVYYQPSQYITNPNFMHYYKGTTSKSPCITMHLLLVWSPTNLGKSL